MTDNKRDLVLPPGSYAYMQDVTKGVVKTYSGPTVINPTAQERPVIYDPGSNTFRGTAALEDAMRIAPIAAEGFYIILRNPARANKHPDEGSAQPAAELEIGRAIIVPGPATFALWPGQSAEVIEGHHLRSNQYLLVRVYNEDEARRNWSKAVVKPAAPEAAIGAAGAALGPGATADPVAAPPPDLTVGKQLIIRGTEVSFYIPPTGIEVVREAESYAREALTLERLEYAILVDENGKKRYEVGPQVVFPLPTERFVEARDDAGRPGKKFRAVELNEIQGLHIKVIADYTEAGIAHRPGDELFITGKDTAIYFPREEHSAIKYDGKAKHFATAIPAGEARYVMNRLTGEIRTVRGPAMLLPDPRSEVIVRRVLGDRECALWYPGNAEALAYNQGIRALLHTVPTTRQGAVSEGDVERGGKRFARPGGGGGATAMEASRVSGDQALVADEFSRASTYTQPRTVTLDSKFQGAPQITVWTGYAVLVVSRTGRRRVEVGPATVLLDYDEGLEALCLSTGQPKSAERVIVTPYLRIDNNQVSDSVGIETRDHVQVELRLAYRVDFEGDPLRWFAVENYVQLLCDRVRSLLKGQLRRHPIEELYAGASDRIRDLVLGAPGDGGVRPGLAFPANGMRIADVDVLEVVVADDRIRALLEDAQHDVVRAHVDLSNLTRELAVTRQREALSRETAEVKQATRIRHYELARELAASELATALARIASSLRESDERKKLVDAEHAIDGMKLQARLDRVARERDQELAFFAREQAQQIELMRAQAETAVQRFTAASGNFSEALLALGRNETLVKVAEAWSVQRLVEGESLGDTLSRLFHNTALKPLVDKLVLANGT